MADCQLCGRPQRADTAYACSPCGDSTERSLHTAADHWPDLQDSIARLVRRGDPTPRAGKPAPAAPIRPDSGIMRHYADQDKGWPGGLPANLAAVEVRDAVRNTVTTWVRLISEERGVIWPVGKTPTLLRWLAGQVGWIRHQPFAAECLDELGDLGRLVVRAVDRPPPRVDAGECGAATDTGPCRQRLSSSPGAAIVHCPVCRATWSTKDRSGVILNAARRLWMYPDEIAQVLTMRGIYTTASMVRNLASRSRITKRTVRDRNEQRDREIYLVKDVEKIRRAKLGMPQLVELDNEDQRTHTPYTVELTVTRGG